MTNEYLDRHIWEGWYVSDFIDELQPLFDLELRYRPFKTKDDLKKWCKDNQPYYKKHIPEVYNHFLKQLML